MIKCENGNVAIEGDGKRLLIDFSMICASMYKLLLENLGDELALVVYDSCTETGIELHDVGESVDTSLLKKFLENRGNPNGKD